MTLGTAGRFGGRRIGTAPRRRPVVWVSVSERHGARAWTCARQWRQEAAGLAASRDRGIRAFRTPLDLHLEQKAASSSLTDCPLDQKTEGGRCWPFS